MAEELQQLLLSAKRRRERVFEEHTADAGEQALLKAKTLRLGQSPRHFGSEIWKPEARNGMTIILYCILGTRTCFLCFFLTLNVL